MAADLHIHIDEGLQEGDLAMFFNHTMGSKHFFLETGVDLQEGIPYEEFYGPDSAHTRVENTPNIWVGQVSWLKATLFEGGAEQFVPHPIMLISSLIGDNLPVINEDLIRKVEYILGTDNQISQYEVSKAKEVVEFLNQHRGKRAFTVSW